MLNQSPHTDSIEKCLSTFAAEMATSSMILGLATKDSLILVDEVSGLRSGIIGAHLILSSHSTKAGQGDCAH